MNTYTEISAVTPAVHTDITDITSFARTAVPDVTPFTHAGSPEDSASHSHRHTVQKVLTAADRVTGIILRIIFTAVWTLCIIHGGIIGLCAVAVAIIYLSATVFANIRHRAVY